MPKIVVTAETERWTSRPADPRDSWDSGDTEGRVTDVIAYIESRTDRSHYGGSVCVDLDVPLGGTVYAVVADYSSGDTFGRSGGHASVLDAFATKDEAEALADALTVEGDWSYSVEHNGKRYYRAWAGYFEELNDLAVWTCTVRRDPADPFRKGTGCYSLRNGS